MKIFGKIVSRTLISVVLIAYIVVALLNYSIVQSTLGALAGDYFSKEWGGTVRIGSIHAMPFDHVILDEVLLVSPDNDTIFDAETLRVGFRRFPFRGHGLEYVLALHAVEDAVAHIALAGLDRMHAALR